jgi:hypothetical protein
MLHRFTEHELLDLIEGQADSAEAQELRRRLAADPRAQSVVERMKSDRGVLRSLEEPECPMDFLLKIEPLLVRPMLMDAADSVAPLPGAMANAGQLRREHRHRTRRIVWSRLALAAVVTMALIAGIWAAVTGLVFTGRGGDSPSLVAISELEPIPSGSISTESSAPVGARALPTGTFHHYRPDPDTVDQILAKSGAGGNDSAEENSDARPSPSGDAFLAAEFALVLETPDAARAQAAVQEVVSNLGDQAAMVRNFSFARAQLLEDEWRAANGLPREHQREPRRAAVHPAPGSDLRAQWRTPDELKALADRVRQRLKKSAPATGSVDLTADVPANDLADDSLDENEGDDQIVGSPTLAPTLEQQLDFSSRGAIYTVAVPAAKVIELVEQLTIAQGQNTALRMLPAREKPSDETPATSETPDAWHPIMVWLQEGPLVRDAIRRLEGQGGNVIVHVPVIVRSGSDAASK